MRILLLSLLILVGCTERVEKKLSNRDVEHARCICKNSGSELRVVKREGDEIHLTCKDGVGWRHEDSAYTEGCSQ